MQIVTSFALTHGLSARRQSTIDSLLEFARRNTATESYDTQRRRDNDVSNARYNVTPGLRMIRPQFKTISVNSIMSWRRFTRNV